MNALRFSAARLVGKHAMRSVCGGNVSAPIVVAKVYRARVVVVAVVIGPTVLWNAVWQRAVVNGFAMRTDASALIARIVIFKVAARINRRRNATAARIDTAIDETLII